MEKFAVFRLGEEDFGITIDKVVEILKAQKIYSIPELPEFFSGVINVRGEVIPLIDLGLRFGLRGASRKGRIITVRFEDEKLGILVDEIDEIVALSPEDITPPPMIFKGLRTEYLTGLGKKDERIIIMLNLDRLLTSEEKIMFSASSDALRREEKKLK